MARFGLARSGSYALAEESLQPNLLTTGQETFARMFATATNLALVSQRLKLTYFTARKSETVTQARVCTGTTGAADDPTLARIGLYSVAANGDISLIASTPNDAPTTMFANTLTQYPKSFSAGVAVTRGQRYALGLLVVSATTMPNFMGVSMGNTAEAGTAPRLVSFISGQADLPASVVSASLLNDSSAPYGVILP